MKTIHIAEAIAQGGRDGQIETANGKLRVDLSTAEEQNSVTPEHLFASAYAACFLGALRSHAEKSHLRSEGATVIARAHLDEDERGGHQLSIDLRATLPGIEEKDARHLMNLAHQTCPYSKAMRGRARVTLSFD
ncbi:MAG TPA: Ohr family peroxiredoxin [Opitutaceae bacterium]